MINQFSQRMENVNLSFFIYLFYFLKTKSPDLTSSRSLRVNILGFSQSPTIINLIFMNSSEKTVTRNVSLTADISVTQNFIQNNHWLQPLKELEPLMYLLAYLPIKGLC